MKTTLDLPADLVREMKLRAAQMGCKVEEVAADLLKRALAPGKATSTRPATKGTIKLPLFPSPEIAPASRMSTAELLALEQETLNWEISSVSACLYDANVWVALAFAAHPHHGIASEHFQLRDSA